LVNERPSLRRGHVLSSEGPENLKVRKRLIGLLLVGVFSVGVAAVFAQTQNTGAAEIVLEGGTSGNVTFPHQRHQAKLADCTICHSAFPQKAGAIEELKAQGKLAKKQIMNEQCTKCHKEKKQAGEKAGPTTCTTCHVKQ
jgi:Cytochrome c7 and related cytochrome c